MSAVQTTSTTRNTTTPSQFNGITPRQAEFIKTLLAERGLDASQIPGEYQTKVGASAVISWLCRQPRAATVTTTPVQLPVATEPAKLEIGVYEMGGEVYVVKPNKERNRLYAKRLVEIGGKRLTETGEVVQIEFEYAPGVIYSLLPVHKMSLERARELTLRYGRCIVCGRRLKDATSVDKGIGPVCRKSFATK